MYVIITPLVGAKRGRLQTTQQCGSLFCIMKGSIQMYQINTVSLLLFSFLFISGCEGGKGKGDEHQTSTDKSAMPEKRIIRFGLYASDSPGLEFKKFNPLLKYFETQLKTIDENIEIKFQAYADYDLCIEAITSGECDFVRTGPASYILAQKMNPDIRLLAMEHSKNKTIFKGVIVAADGGPIQKLKDIRGKTFAFGDKNSTIGRYLSQAVLVKEKIYAKDLKSYQYLGRHDLVAKSVISGTHDVGSIKESTFNRYKKKLRVIHEFDNITKPWIASAQLDQKLFLKLQEILVNLNKPELLKIIKKSGFKIATDADYNFVREQMVVAKSFAQGQ